MQELNATLIQELIVKLSVFMLLDQITSEKPILASGPCHVLAGL